MADSTKLKGELLSYVEGLRAQRQVIEGQRKALDLKIAKAEELLHAIDGSGQGQKQASGHPRRGRRRAVTGLTDSVLDIIRGSATPLTPRQIRDRMVEKGFKEEKYSNMLTVVYNTLKRLVEQGEIESGVVDGKKVYSAKR